MQKLGSAQTRQGLCPCTPPPFEKGGPKLFGAKLRFAYVLCIYRGDAANRNFWAAGYYVSTAGLNTAAIQKYIREQEKQDQIEDSLSKKEYSGPFKGSKQLYHIIAPTTVA